ncbi:MAG: hypothetical protein JXQ73_24345 [Phycisphaerae bacterium]|nr:hypothetical protein [Phycisphaerae bacterium]
MAKGKRTPALFEIINRAQVQGENPHLQVPGWWRNLSETAECDKNLAPPSSHEVAAAEAETAANYDRVAEAVEEAASQVFEEAISEEASVYEDAEPTVMDYDTGPEVGGRTLGSVRSAVRTVIRLDSGRVEVSLGLIGVVISGGLLLLGLYGSFAWGYVRGDQAARAQMLGEAEDSVELARKMHPDASVLNPAQADYSSPSSQAPQSSGSVKAMAAMASPSPSSAEASGTPSAAGGIRRVGWNYLVIQSFRGPDAKREATKAEQFVVANLPPIDGQPPVTVETVDGGYVLLSTIGYPSGDDARRKALEEFKEQVQRVGKQYRERGSGYDFRDAYPRKLSQASMRRK